MMKTEYKHIWFDETESPERKTKTFICRNRRGAFLGHLQWERSWRQYCFYPSGLTVFSHSCLVDVQHFIQQLMDERKITP